MRRLLAAGECGGGLHAIVAGNALGGWARLGAGTSGLAWHVAPSDEAWLAVAEAVMCAGAQPPEHVTRAARQITSEIGDRLAAPGGPGGWLAWTADGACARPAVRKLMTCQGTSDAGLPGRLS